MNDKPIREITILASLALAAHYFPISIEGDDRVAAPFNQASFLLTGKYRAWSRWTALPHDEKQRIALVCRSAPADLADPRFFATAARTLLARPPETGADDVPTPLAQFDLVGENPYTAQAAFPRVGGDLLGYVDRQTARFRRPSARPKPPAFAGPGAWTTREIFVKGAGQVQGRLTIPAYAQFTEPLGHDQLPTVTTAPYQETLRIPTGELLALAEQLDRRPPLADAPYLHATLTQLFGALNTNDAVSPQEALILTAGGLEIFHAPTGTGKSILVRVMASWFAINHRRVAIVLPDIKACLNLTWDVRGDLAHLRQLGVLDHPATCAHLMSSSGMHDKALKHASLLTEDPGAPGDWGEHAERDVDPLAYGCAQKTFLQTSGGDYPPGEEPCLSLRGKGTESTACPWIPTCGKFTPVYDACAADVVILNHHMFLQGSVKIGVTLDGHSVRGMKAAELTLRACEAVLVDEVDLFQSTAVGNCASDVVLHSRRHWSAAPQEIDTDAKRLPLDDENNLLAAISHTRLMAESLLLGICRNALRLHATEDERAQTRIPDRTSTRWHLAQARDRALIRLLWSDAPVDDDQPIPGDLYDRLNALMPSRYRRDPAAGQGPLPEADWPAARRALEALVTPRGEDLLDEVKLDLHAILEDTVKDVHRRTQAINLLTLRTVMLELDDALALLQDKAHGYRSIGLRSAQRILDNLHQSAVSSVLPQGMLGYPITGYRVTGLEDTEKNAQLAAQTLTGDPHTFAAELGGIVSLLLAGLERPVLGLSATAYFPQAVREHLHAPVRWWMTDAQAKSIRARKHRVTYGDDHPLAGQAIRISGTHKTQKKEAALELGAKLYDEHIHAELERTTRKDPDRAHVLVVANSYEQCAQLATGITRAGTFDGGLCVAVRDADPRNAHQDLPRASLAKRLTPEQFEDFPRHGKILVVPLQRIARGLNIVKGTRSAVRSVYLCVRPLALVGEPDEMYGSINAAGLRALPPGGSDDPAKALAEARSAARERLTVLLRTAPQFTAMHKSLQEEIVAGVIVDLIQLAGRARRGGTEAVLHLVDYAFHDDTWSSDLETILGRIHSQWDPEVRQHMNDLYGEALRAFLSYAGIDPDQP
ncbi:hypothetical protein [Pseudofrankia sp. DC12]|uniref:hypothetical protein n=1 Tax=Pseudofrankia sp. DC12 TaxID=683315 RepID=UPI0005F7F900|nr:hypothetical protein [Pseudofrankia sp. DC12]